LYKHGTDGHIHQEYSDGEETVSSLSSDDDLVSLAQNVKTLNVNDPHIPSKETLDPTNSRSSSSLANSSRTSSPFFNPKSTQIQSMNDYTYSANGSNLNSVTNNWNEQENLFWPTSDSFLLQNQRENS
jgi:hypothetical protein